MTKTRTIQHQRSNTAKARSQQRSRRKIQLFLKAYEYCLECDADISLTIRLRHNGETVFFNSDGSWSPSKEQLIWFWFFTSGEEHFEAVFIEDYEEKNNIQEVYNSARTEIALRQTLL